MVRDPHDDSLSERPGVLSAIPEIVWSPLASGILMVIPGVLGLLVGQPWLFPSLGPTAFLQAQAPDLPMSKLYNTLVGHFVGIVAGYLAVFLLGLDSTDSVFAIHHLSAGRMWASVIAVSLTLAAQIPLRATHAPAAATTLLISLGGFGRKWVDIESLTVGILLVAFVGELFRLLRGTRRTPTER